MTVKAVTTAEATHANIACELLILDIGLCEQLASWAVLVKMQKVVENCLALENYSLPTIIHQITL